MARTLAITGGTGFVGQHTLAHALARGHRIRALTRQPQAAQGGVDWVQGTLLDASALQGLCEGADAVIHIAGVTNAASREGFITGNVLGTAFLRRAAGSLPLVHVSSLSAREPALSTYGWSKHVGEQIAIGCAGPVAVVRPPAVYGPGDREFLELLRVARLGVVPIPAQSMAAMIYGPDLAEALVALAEDLSGARHAAGAIYEIDDGQGHHSPQGVADAMGAALGRRVRALSLPPALLRLGATVETAVARGTGRLPRISHDRAAYMAHRDWSADSRAIRALGIWEPRTPLAHGMAQTVAAYRHSGLLR